MTFDTTTHKKTKDMYGWHFSAAVNLLYEGSSVDMMDPNEGQSRHSVLLKFLNWEKDHGNMSLDVFPGFMYDSKPNGYRKLSFLWRLFRYEDEPENGVSADFLFVPLCRPVLR